MNALQLQYGMDNIVLQILVKAERFGIITINHVFVLVIKFSIKALVSHPKFLVKLVKFGIHNFMPAVVQINIGGMENNV